MLVYIKIVLMFLVLFIAFVITFSVNIIIPNFIHLISHVQSTHDIKIEELHSAANAL